MEYPQWVKISESINVSKPKRNLLEKLEEYYPEDDCYSVQNDIVLNTDKHIYNMVIDKEIMNYVYYRFEVDGIYLGEYETSEILNQIEKWED